MKQLFTFFFIISGYLTYSQSISICGDNTPFGYITTDISGVCKTVSTGSTTLNYIGRTIKKIDDLPTGSIETVCGDDIPPYGWVTTEITSVCKSVSTGSTTLNYIGRKIKKIIDLPTGSIETICGDNIPPDGWVTIDISGVCKKVSTGSSTFNFIGRTIKKISDLPTGSIETICGDDTPPYGWVTSEIIGVCKTVSTGSTTINYIGRKIKKIDGLPDGSIETICGDDKPPYGWVTIDITGVCKNVNPPGTAALNYIGRTIMKLNDGGLLPLIFLSFDAAHKQNKVFINWSTANEINNDHFTLERSSNNKDFSMLANINGKGDGSNKYSFVDYSPLTGVSFYRLKQTDKDGNFTYSSIATVNNQQSGTDIHLTASMSPNPTKDYINITTNKTGNFDISIYDAIGKQVATYKKQVAAFAPFMVGVSSLASGTYMVLVKDEKETVVVKMVKE